MGIIKKVQMDSQVSIVSHVKRESKNFLVLKKKLEQNYFVDSINQMLLSSTV